MKLRLESFLVLVVLIAFLPACSRERGERKTEEPKKSVEVVEEKSDKASEVRGATINGKILEVVDSGSFVFILLDRGEERIWATLPSVEVEVGEEVDLLDASIFRKFYSKSLDRTFDQLIFATGIAGKTGVGRAAFGRNTE